MTTTVDIDEASVASLSLPFELRDPTEAKKDLKPSEVEWANLQPWLAERGYRLRARYQPGWKASWGAEGFSGNPSKCEDFQTHMHPWVMDAVRVRDGALVMMKRVKKSSKGSEEVQLAEFLSEKSLASDSQNHCVQIYEILDVPETEDEVLLVMPLLYTFRLQPDFNTVGEVIDFFKQAIEGLLFMHRHNIAYRDCKHDNILADTVGLYDHLPHPILLRSSYDGQSTLKQRHSRTRKPVKYYYIDFGLSKRYPSRNGNFEPSPWGAAVYTVPEFQVPLSTPTDPFPVDIYMMGMMFRQQFLEETKYGGQKVNLEWMNELARDMTSDDPKARPTIEEVMNRFSELTKKLGPWKSRAPVYHPDDPMSTLQKTKHWIIQVSRMLRFIPAIPSPQRMGAPNKRAR